MQKKRRTPSVILRAVSIGFLVGVTLASFLFLDDGSFSQLQIAVELLIVTVSSWLLLRRFAFENRLLLTLVVLLAVSLGLTQYSRTFPNQNSVAYANGQSVRIIGTIVDVDQTEKNQKLVLSDLKIDGRNFEDRALIFTPMFPKFKYGDQISMRCDLKEPEPFEGFRYDRFLSAKKIYVICFLYQAPLIIDRDMGNPVIAGLLRNRSKMINKIDQIFGEPHASLLAGLLLGEQRFSKEWDERFFRTGTTHIVAASGYNVAVVTFIMFGVLAWLGIKRPRAFAFILASILAYVVLAGAEAAVVRAGVMGILVLLSRQLGRKSTMLNVLLLTAGVMLFINPRLLRDDVGFQLSMLSTIALIYFAPMLEKKFKFIPEDFTIRESLTATLAATIFTFPLVFFSFKAFSLVSPVVNLLILPLIPYAMFFGAAAVAIGFVSTPVAIIASGPAWALLSAALFIVESMAALPISIIEYASN